VEPVAWIVEPRATVESQSAREIPLFFFHGLQTT